jgi:hypothetical protein
MHVIVSQETSIRVQRTICVVDGVIFFFLEALIRSLLVAHGSFLVGRRMLSSELTNISNLRKITSMECHDAHLDFNESLAIYF